MFRRFASIISQVPGLQVPSGVVEKDYGDEKSAANDYQVTTFHSFFLYKFQLQSFLSI